MCGRHRAAWAALALCLWSSVVWVGAGEGRRTRLVTKTTEEEEEGEVLPRPGASTREREIAAIFRGVAYGAPTTTTSSTTTTTTTSTTTTSTTTTTRTPAAARPPDHRREGEGGGASQPASRRDEEQRRGSGSPPLTGGEGVVNITTEVWRGAAWGARAYLTGGLFCVVGVAALCLAPRAAHVSPLLSTPHFLALHFFVLAAAVCRCLHLLHDAPHVGPALPEPLLTAAEEGAWPLLTAGLAVLVGGALRAWLSPARPRLALVLAGAAAAHLASLAVTHLGAALLKVPHPPIALAASTVAITLGTAVGVAGLWVVWPLGRNTLFMGRVVGEEEACGGPASPSHLLMAASVVELLLAGVRLYLLTTQPTLSPVWAWWCRITLPHVLELLLAALLLAAAALTASPPACILYCGCCQKRTAEVVHPSAVKMVHPLGVYTVEEVAAAPPKNQHARTLATLSVAGSGGTTKLKHRDHKSLDYVTSDFQLVWSHVRPLAAPRSGHRLDDADDFLTLPAEKPDLPRAHLVPLAPAGVLGTEVYTCSLPSYRLYAAAPSAPYHQERGSGTGRGGGVGAAPPYRHSATLSRGSSGRVYSSPQASLRTSRSWDELSTSHIYEEPQRATSGSVEEALSDLSDLVTDCPSDPASPDPPSARRRHPLPFHHSSSTLTVPGKHHPQRSREPLPLPGTPPPSSQTLPLLPPASTPSNIHPPKILHPRV